MECDWNAAGQTKAMDVVVVFFKLPCKFFAYIPGDDFFNNEILFEFDELFHHCEGSYLAYLPFSVLSSRL